MILELAYYDDPFLRKKALPVDEITDDVREFIANLIETMQNFSNGIGLAATQVKSLYRIFVICPLTENVEGKTHIGHPEVFINPVLSEPEEKTEVITEGCLSFPGLYVPIQRPLAITVEAQDPEGNSFKKRFTGYVARQIMHENDHLNGVLYIDRLKIKERQSIESKLAAIKKQFRK